ncbi:MAG: sulfur carrier protein ThiS [Ruminococcus sp.]|nr:sulfur carrier protein ThiS [Ruminococcus sp.]
MTVNGEFIELSSPIDLKTFLESQGYNINRIAVEINYEIIPKSTYQNVILSEKDVLEIVSFMGGG